MKSSTVLSSKTPRVIFIDVEPPSFFINHGFPGNSMSKGIERALGFPIQRLDVRQGILPSWEDLNADLVLIGGSTSSTITHTESWQPILETYLQEGIQRGNKVLGICYGAQAMAKALGGVVIKDPSGGEYGVVTLTRTNKGKKHKLFHGLPDVLTLYTSHEDAILRIPNATILASDSIQIDGVKKERIQVAVAGPNDNAIFFQTHFSELPETFWLQLAEKRKQRLRERKIWHAGLLAEIKRDAPDADFVGKKVLNNILIYALAK